MSLLQQAQIESIPEILSVTHLALIRHALSGELGALLGLRLDDRQSLSFSLPICAVRELMLLFDLSGAVVLSFQVCCAVQTMAQFV